MTTQAEKELASRSVITFGLPREVDPQQALLEEVHRTAGHVAWLQAKIASLPTDADLKQLDKGERLERPAVWVEMYQAERKHQTRVAEAAIRCGIAERQVRLAEAQGAQLAGVLRGVLDAVFRRSPTPACRARRASCGSSASRCPRSSSAISGRSSTPRSIESCHTQTPANRLYRRRAIAV
jgi:hypothetical protein